MTADLGGPAPQLAVGVTSVRIQRLSPPARTLHRAILRAFASTGHAPAPAMLAALAGRDLPSLLDELHQRDVVRLDEHG